MLTLRQRGKNKIYSVRGSVTLRDKCITVSERSSGTSDKSAATFFKNQLENDLKHELMFGKKAQVAKVTVADALRVCVGTHSERASRRVRSMAEAA